jgi:hypothetical protein
MAKTTFFIDGFNLHYSLRENPAYRQFMWLDCRKLAQCFIRPGDEIEKIFYFTADPLDSPAKEARHVTYMAALESLGINIVKGAYKKRDRKCSHCGFVNKTYEEKLTDVTARRRDSSFCRYLRARFRR